MSKFFSLMCALSTIAMLSGCGRGKVVIPSPAKMDVEPSLKDLMTCSKKESEQTFSKKALSHRILIQDKVVNKDIETVDCNGKVVSRAHGPVSSVIKTVTIRAPRNLTDTVDYIEITNQRTCTVLQVGAVEDEALQDIYVLPNGKKLKLPLTSTQASTTGEIKLVITDQAFRLFNQLNVRDGENAVQIRYFRKCFAYEKNRALDEVPKCTDGDLIATKDLVIDLDVKRPEADGVKKISQCDRK